MTNALRSISHSPSHEVRATSAMSCHQNRMELPSSSVLLQTPGLEMDVGMSNMTVEDGDAHSSQTSYLSARSFVFDSDGRCQALVRGNGVGDGEYQGQPNAQLEGLCSNEGGCVQKTSSA